MQIAFKWPQTVPEPRFDVHAPGMPAARIPLARRTPRLMFSPAATLVGWPAVRDEHELDLWLRATNVSVGDHIAYYAGPSLAAARPRDPVVNTLAWAVALRSDQVLPLIAPCGHVRGMVQGSGQITTFQRRINSAFTVYFVRRVLDPSSRRSSRARPNPVRTRILEAAA